MSDTGHLKCPRCGKELSPSAPEGLCPACLGALNFATETEVTGMDAREALPPLTPAELAPHFPQLEILECLGRGGMGVVYKARQKSLNRLVALKLLAPERVQDAKFAERFAREAQALAALNHPSIVTVHDFGQAGGFYFLLMEFVDGVNLRQLLRSRKLQPAEALAIVPPVCEALQYAHEHGIVHRDIKPENLLLAKDGRVKIADFGIAKMLGAEASSASVSLASSGGEGQGEEAAGTSATQQTTMGTPQYMAPEQREQPQAADHRADIYSLGVVLYELLTGELPTDKLQPPSRVRGVQIDVRLDEIVLRALEKTPELRYQTAGEFKTQVEAVTASVDPAASKPSALLKQARGRYTSPEYLATPVGGFLKHEGKGELSLFADHLIFAAAGQRARIPFDSLRQLAAARGPRWTSPAGHQYLSLIYDEGGQKRHLLFMAGEGFFQLAADTEDTVADWIAAIQAAVRDSGRKSIPVPEGGSVVFGASPWLAALILIPMLLLAMLPWVFQVARVLNPGSNHAPEPNRWIGLLPLLGLVGGGIVAVVFLSRRRKHSSASGKSVSFHIATIIFYAGVILGILFIGMLSLRFSRDSAYLLVVGIMVVVSPFVGVLTGNALQQAEQAKDQSSLERIRGRLQALSVVAWVLAVPVVGFAVFFFFAVLSQQGGWTPAMSEAVLVPLTWLGAGLLPWAAMKLRQLAIPTVNGDQPKKRGGLLWAAGLLLAVGLMVVLLAGTVWIKRADESRSVAREKLSETARLAKAQLLVTKVHQLEGSPFIARLPYGGSMELLAVRLSPGDTNQAWWQPDGSPSSYGTNITMEGAGGGGREVLGLAKIKWPQPPAGKEAYGVSLNGGRFALKDGFRMLTEDLRVIRFEQVAVSGDEGTLFVSVGVRDWETVLTLKPGALNALTGGAARKQWEFSATPSGNLKLSVKKLVQQPGSEYQLVAVDEAGKHYTPNIVKTTTTTGKPDSEYEALFDGVSGSKDALKVDQVKEVYWQRRSLDSVEFARVSMKPGHLTQVAVRDYAATETISVKEAVDQVGGAYPGEWIWEPNSETLKRVPRLFFLRESTLPKDWTPSDMFGADRYLARGKTLEELMSAAWSQKDSGKSIVLEGGQPDIKFDLIITAQPQWWETLRLELIRRFKLVEEISADSKTVTYKPASGVAGPSSMQPAVPGGNANVSTVGSSFQMPTRFAFPVVSIVFTGILVALFLGVVALVVWGVRKNGTKGCLLAAAILLALVFGLIILALLVSLWSYRAQRVTAMPVKVLALSGTATLVHEYEQDLRWRWRVTKQRPAQVLFGVLDTDATGTYTNVIPVSLRESLPKDDDWSRAKDIVLTLIKEGKASTLKLEDQFIVPEPLRPNTVSTVVSLQSWQNIITQSKPVTLSSEYYQTLWEAEIVRYSADGKIKSPRRLRLVARLADPKQPEDFFVLSEDDPVKEIRPIEMNADPSREKSVVSPGLVTKEIVEQARQQAERAKLLQTAGRVSSGEVIDAETHLKWAEAMFQGDVRGALVAKRDGAAAKLQIAEALAKDRIEPAERDKAARELAEAEAALKLFDLKEIK